MITIQHTHRINLNIHVCKCLQKAFFLWGGHLKFKSHPDEKWDKYLWTVKNTDLAQKKKKRKKKGIGFQVNEKKNHLIPNRYLVVENGSNSKNKYSYTKNTL